MQCRYKKTSTLLRLQQLKLKPTACAQVFTISAVCTACCIRKVFSWMVYRLRTKMLANVLRSNALARQWNVTGKKVYNQPARADQPQGAHPMLLGILILILLF